MLATLALVLSATLLSDGPFADLGYDAALEQAKKEKKLLLVDFTASWCPPCHKMEKDTWGAEDVRAWLKANAIAIQVDVDEQEELSGRFQIEAMPTVVAVRDGQEFDRTVGYRGPKDFLAWAGDVLAGKRATDGLLERSKALRASDDLNARYELAQELFRARKYDEALAHYLWIWPASRSAMSWGGVRLSFLLGDIDDLIRKHEPAKKAFFALLDELQTKVDKEGTPGFEDWSEWSSMSRSFGEQTRVVAWYEKRKDERGRLFGGVPKKFPEPIIASEVFEVLMEAQRPVDGVRLYEDGALPAQLLVDRFKMMAASLERFDPEDKEMMEKFQRNDFTHKASALYAGLLLDDRSQQAARVAEMLLDTLDTPEARIDLVEAGIEIARRREEAFAGWLDEAERAGASVQALRQRLEKLPAVVEPAPAGAEKR